MERTWSASQAARELGVRVSTLYAYVSRGLLHSESAGKSRQRRYRAAEVRALKRRRGYRRDPRSAAQDSLHWGLPVVESKISLIADGRIYFRGHDVIELASTRSAEEVAALLWTGELDSPFPPDRLSIPDRIWSAIEGLSAGLSPIERFRIGLSIAAPLDGEAGDLRPPAVFRTGARILRLLVAVATGSQTSARSLAGKLQRSWVSGNRRARDLLGSALALCADHELTAATFAVRCVASAGADPWAAVLAGVSALGGARHGGSCGRIEALFDEAGTPDCARSVIADHVRRGERIAGFGHPLYPDGDPRGRYLLDAIDTTRANAPRLARALVEATGELAGERPTVDFGLVALCRTLGLPNGSALGLLALARTSGWIAHAMEEYQSGRSIRPRALYGGPWPVVGVSPHTNGRRTAPR